MKQKSALKWIMQNTKKENGKIVVLLIANAIFSALAIVFAFLIKEIIDSAVNSNMQRLISFAVAIIGIVFLQFAFRIFTNCLQERIQAKLEMQYKTALFKSILNKKQEKISTYHSGELMTRLTSDVVIVSDGVATILPTIVSAFARLICAVVALIMLDWIFAVAFSVAGLSVFAVITLLRNKLKSFHKRAQETDGKVRSFMQECIENLLAVKVFSVNDRIEKQSTEQQKKNFDIRMTRRNYSVLGHATYNFIFSAGYLFALIYGGVKLLSGIITYGALSAILQLVNNVQVPFASLSNIMPKYYSMIASAERIMEIEQIEDEQKSKEIDRDNLYDKLKGIAIENATFTYDRDKVLNGGSVYINKGEFVAISGPSGVGKSTLIKLLLGVYSLDTGNAYLDLGDSKIDLDNSTRLMFSYVPQGNMLFSGTLKDNITFINDIATKEEIDFALSVSQVSEFISELPQGLDTLVGENGVGLSEGQIQRIAIARAILTNAPIILLDEATSALDEQTEKAVLNNLKALENKTIIIVSHKKAAIEICDRNVQIKDKKIKEITKSV